MQTIEEHKLLKSSVLNIHKDKKKFKMNKECPETSLLTVYCIVTQHNLIMQVTKKKTK